jgi:hypothetical protein
VVSSLSDRWLGLLNLPASFPMLLADVIFPAPSSAYVACIAFPVAALLALVTEFAVFVYFQRGVLSKPRLLGAAIGVNLFSWLVGGSLSFLLPSGLVPKLVSVGDHEVYVATTGPHWSPIAIAGFFWACLLSFGLEYGALRALRKWLRFQRLALCVGVANVASYCVIAAVVAFHLHFDLF